MNERNAKLCHNLQPRKHAALIDRAASIHNCLSRAQVPMRSCGLDMRSWSHQGGRIFPLIPAAIPRRSRAHPFEYIMLLDGATGAFGYRRRHGSAFLPFPFLPVQRYITETVRTESNVIFSQLIHFVPRMTRTVLPHGVCMPRLFSGQREFPVSSNQSVDGQIRNKGCTGFRLQDCVPGLPQRG